MKQTKLQQPFMNFQGDNLIYFFRCFSVGFGLDCYVPANTV